MKKSFFVKSVILVLIASSISACIPSALPTEGLPPEQGKTAK